MGAEAGDLIWDESISSSEAIRRAQELVDAAKKLPKSAIASKKWLDETFGTTDDLLKTVMAFHVTIFTSSWRATSGMENIFNVFKKYNKAELKRSILFDAVCLLLETVERRLGNDAILLEKHPDWFIDERTYKNAKKNHKKELSSRQLFLEESVKLQDGSRCPWNECIPLEDRKMWLLFEKCSNGRQIAHLVDLNGFGWTDSDDNVPPRCHTCPFYRNGCIPCIGILTVLQNLKPLVGPSSISDWLKGKGLERPEIFHNRWRIDKDPTMHMSNSYTLVPRKQQQRDRDHEMFLPLIPADLSRRFEDQVQRAQALAPGSQAAALARIAKSLSENDAVLAIYERDSKIQKMTKQAGLQRQSMIDIRRGLGGDESGKKRRFPETGSQLSTISRAKKVQKPAGTSDGIPEEDKWTCIACNRAVLNEPAAVKQHCRGTTHQKNMDKWKASGSKDWPFSCSTCNYTMIENDPETNASLIRKHKEKHEYHCLVCNVKMRNNPKARKEHFESLEHDRQLRLQAEQHRDGPECAEKQRVINGKKRSRQ
jgi:hypothetical protein